MVRLERLTDGGIALEGRDRNGAGRRQHALRVLDLRLRFQQVRRSFPLVLQSQCRYHPLLSRHGLDVSPRDDLVDEFLIRHHLPVVGHLLVLQSPHVVVVRALLAPLLTLRALRRVGFCSRPDSLFPHVLLETRLRGRSGLSQRDPRFLFEELARQGVPGVHVFRECLDVLAANVPFELPRVLECLVHRVGLDVLPHPVRLLPIRAVLLHPGRRESVSVGFRVV